MELPVIGQKVKITKNLSWSGVYTIVRTNVSRRPSKAGRIIIVIKHPLLGEGGFYLDEVELIPLTPLEKLL